MNRRFADTYYFIALFHALDDGHARAMELSRDRSFGLMTTRWVHTEFADGFAASAYREEIAAFIESLMTHADIVVVPANDELFLQGLALYRSRPDKQWSLTDCISFVVMRDWEIQEALTADHHFEQAGFAALL